MRSALVARQEHVLLNFLLERIALQAQLPGLVQRYIITPTAAITQKLLFDVCCLNNAVEKGIRQPCVLRNAEANIQEACRTNVRELERAT